MANKTKTRTTRPETKGSEKKEEGQQFETMSQKQNRHGKGRQQNGSDGTGKGRGSNH